MSVRALLLFAVLAVSIVPALGEELGYYADDDLTDTDYGSDEYGDTDYVRSVKDVDQQDGRDTHRFEDFVHIEHGGADRSRRAQVAHYTASELTTPSERNMPGELVEPIDPEYEELPYDEESKFWYASNGSSS